ncbi:hypothetical protein [Plantactinospora sp. GCM10030261]|uniref:hypothetical protein n=1 Tax=Plantactinospora sp. GCM10030261 TaxID=3273420 RepID=UPI0036062A5E
MLGRFVLTVPTRGCGRVDRDEPYDGEFRATNLGLEDPGGFWADLRFPDVLAVDVVDRTVSRVELPGG